MPRDHEAVVDAQFGPRAEAYLQSAVHAHGADLDRISERVRDAAPGCALDLGTGGGHVAYRLAEKAGQVVACDLSADMLDQVARTAAQRGLTNMTTTKAAAERLPFEAATFDFLACRFSAHHWQDFEQGLREARRVLKSGASAIFIDAVAPPQALLDSHLQAVELLRDTSHVRDYAPAEWTAALGRSGFVLQRAETWRLRMDFPTWTARMRTPQINAAAIRALQASAPADVRAYFGIETDGSFQLDVLMVETRAA